MAVWVCASGAGWQFESADKWPPTLKLESLATGLRSHRAERLFGYQIAHASDKSFEILHWQGCVEWGL